MPDNNRQHSSLGKRLVGIYQREGPPNNDLYIQKLRKVIHTLDNEDPVIRPRDSKDRPGGLVFIKKGVPVIIVPDLHARMDLILLVVLSRLGDRPLIDLLASGEAGLVFLGDGFHAERRAFDRWQAALDEYISAYQEHENMDREMAESLGAMEMVMELKSTFPEMVHFLKGNHENITNEHGGGNRPFYKYAFEGEMVLEYVRHFYSEEFLSLYYYFEKCLPLLAVGNRFLVSHSEPQTYYPRQRLVNYREDPDLVYGLTWTDNDSAEEDSVDMMLRSYLATDDITECFYLGGHRPVHDRYQLRAGGRYVQIHNPQKRIAARLRADGSFNPEKDILEYRNDLDALFEEHNY